MNREVKISRAKPLSEKIAERKEFQERPSGNRGSSRGGRGARGDTRKRSSNFKREYKPRHKDDNSIYVGNLSYRTNEMKLGRHFEKYGDIKEVRVAEDENERSRGFGYVEFEKHETVALALVANGEELDSRKIVVAKVEKKEKRPRKTNEIEIKE